MKVGDRVRMSSVGKARYINNDCNPHNGKGRVIRLNGVKRCQVRWDNGHENNYSFEDLKSLKSGLSSFLEKVDKEYPPLVEVEKPKRKTPKPSSTKEKKLKNPGGVSPSSLSSLLAEDVFFL